MGSGPGSLLRLALALGAWTLAWSVQAGPGAATGTPASSASASTATPPDAPPTHLVSARDLFVKGADLVSRAQWYEALSAFEQSSRLRPHPVTTYNIAVCERAIGQYARARIHFREALTGSADEPGGGLSDVLRERATEFLAEVDRLLARVHVRLTPAGSGLTVDGRSLAPSERERALPTFVAGLSGATSTATRLPASVVIVVDPGTRVFAASRRGFAGAVESLVLAPGSSTELVLQLDRLPARLRVAADRPDVAVTVDGLDVGVAPVEIARPPGTHTVLLRKPGFVPYEARVAVRAGEVADIRGRLPPEPETVMDRWWFWPSAALTLVVAVGGTWALTRSDPQRPPPDGGSLDWVVLAR